MRDDEHRGHDVVEVPACVSRIVLSHLVGGMSFPCGGHRAEGPAHPMFAPRTSYVMGECAAAGRGATDIECRKRSSNGSNSRSGSKSPPPSARAIVAALVG